MGCIRYNRIPSVDKPWANCFMYSDPIARATLVQQMPQAGDRPSQGAVVRDYIRSQKAQGRLVERRVFVDPAHSRKRRQVFQFVATNLELDF